jgi:hypothetical protein
MLRCGHFRGAPYRELTGLVCLVRLSLLDSPTCVGLQYGRMYHCFGAFLGPTQT